MPRDLRLEKGHQYRIHEVVLIGDVETHDALPIQMRSELLAKPVPMGLLHHEDQLRPVQQLRGKHILCIMVQPYRRDLDPLPQCNDLLRCRATQPILAVHKKTARHRERTPNAPHQSALTRT